MPNNSSKAGKSTKRKLRPLQSQARPGVQNKMDPQPVTISAGYRGSGKLEGRVALITGGDSGIGRSIAVHFAAEGADVAISYYSEEQDARQTAEMVRGYNRRCELIVGDLATKKNCVRVVDQTVKKLGKIDILVNNAATQYPTKSIDDMNEKDLDRTFKVNILSMFFLTASALPHLRKQSGSTIINTTSVTAYRGSPHLLDYSSTKGAIVSFTRSLSASLAKENIRVNGVAPGPIWTPLIPSTFEPSKVSKFGSDVPMGRAGQPWECATCFVFLASSDSSYMTGQILHPNGGEIVNG